MLGCFAFLKRTFIGACCYLLLVNCWPNEVGSKCDVNIEYSLENADMELSDVVITIPLPYVPLCFISFYCCRSEL